VWEKYYSWTPYQYSANNPVSFLDGGGLKVEIVGTQEEIKPLFQGLCLATGTMPKYTKTFNNDGTITLDITGFESVDNRFSEEQGKLNELIGSITTYSINKNNEADKYGGGMYDPKTQAASVGSLVYNRKAFYNRTQTERERSIVNKILNWTLGYQGHSYSYYDFYDIIAHEFLGHAYDQYKGRLRSEYNAKKTANQVRKKRGKPLRDRGD